MDKGTSLSIINQFLEEVFEYLNRVLPHPERGAVVMVGSKRRGNGLT